MPTDPELDHKVLVVLDHSTGPSEPGGKGAYFGRSVNPISGGGQIMPTTLLIAPPDVQTLCWLCSSVVKTDFP